MYQGGEFALQADCVGFDFLALHPPPVEMCYAELMGYTGEKKKEYQRLWMQKRKAKALQYLGGKCVECGSEDDLEFDHIDRSTKEKAIGQSLSYKWEVLKIELDKCQILCKTHHLEKTLAQMPEWKGKLEHGTHSMYSTGKCRCDKCTEAHAKLAREYRAVGRKW